MFELLAAAAALLPTILEVTVNLVIFAAIVTKALQALGIIGPDENAKELGDKAIQAEEEGITPENYDSYEEYMDAVRKFELDPEKSEQIEDEDKLKKGTEIFTTVMVDRLGKVSAEDLLVVMAKNPMYFENRMPLIMEKLKDTPEKLKDITDFMQGRHYSPEKDDEVASVLYDIEKKVNPDATMEGMLRDLKEIEKRGGR